MTDNIEHKEQMGYVQGDIVAAQIAAWCLNIACEAAAVDKVSQYDLVLAMRAMVSRISPETMEMLKRGEIEIEFGAMPFDETAETVGGAQ